MTEYEEEKSSGVGNVLRTIGNQQLIKQEYKGVFESSNKPITLHAIQESDITRILERVELICKELNITKHGRKHAEYVAIKTGEILKKLGFPLRDIQLGEIAGYLHDIGYVIDAKMHHFIGAGMAYERLHSINMLQDEIDKICFAIAYHKEKPINNICAAIILADASDFGKQRLRNEKINNFLCDLMSQCNYNELNIDNDKKIISLELSFDFIDSSEKEFLLEFNEFSFNLCKESAKIFGCEYKVIINKEILF